MLETVGRYFGLKKQRRTSRFDINQTDATVGGAGYDLTISVKKRCTKDIVTMMGVDSMRHTPRKKIPDNDLPIVRARDQ